jgi:hypothetical protein
MLEHMGGTGSASFFFDRSYEKPDSGGKYRGTFSL